MSASPLARLLDKVRDHLHDRSARPAAGARPGRRRFLRRASLSAAGVVGAGMALPDEVWAGVEERAQRFGITPGTVVDAQGRQIEGRQGTDPYLGEIMLFGGNFAVRGYAFCQGQLLPISANSALFSLLGTTYGGDGRTTFGLPDLRGRSAIGFGMGPGLSDHPLGQKAGQETVTLTTATMPSHTHPIAAHNAPGSLRTPAGNILAGDATNDTIYSPPASSNANLSPPQSTGGGQAFGVRDPFLALNYQIALAGVFPSRS